MNQSIIRSGAINVRDGIFGVTNTVFNNAAPQNLLTLGHCVDGSIPALFFDSGLTGKMDFINTQLTSVPSEINELSCFIYAALDSDFHSTFYNIASFLTTDTSYILEENTGTIVLQTVSHHGDAGYSRFLSLLGGNLQIINSYLYNSYSDGNLSDLSVIGTFFVNFEGLDLSSTKHNIGNILHRTHE
jgi:hypothetical protein